MTSIKHYQGFTLVEVMVAMVLVSTVALSTMYALKMSSRREFDVEPMSRVFMSYKNIKGRFHELLSNGEVLESSYQCVLKTQPEGSRELFEKSICDEELAIEPAGKYAIQVSQANDPATCIYQVQLTIRNKLSGSAISRRWSDQC